MRGLLLLTIIKDIISNAAFTPDVALVIVIYLLTYLFILYAEQYKYGFSTKCGWKYRNICITFRLVPFRDLKQLFLRRKFHEHFRQFISGLFL